MEQVIIYGIGATGKKLLECLKYRNEESIIKCFCDIRSDAITNLEGYAVIAPAEAIGTGIPIVVAVENKEFKEEIRSFLEKEHAKYFQDGDGEGPLQQTLYQDRKDFFRPQDKSHLHHDKFPHRGHLPGIYPRGRAEGQGDSRREGRRTR